MIIYLDCDHIVGRSLNVVRLSLAGLRCLKTDDEVLKNNSRIFENNSQIIVGGILCCPDVFLYLQLCPWSLKQQQFQPIRFLGMWSFGPEVWWDEGVRSMHDGGIRELHAMTNSVNHCEVWMGREEGGDVLVKDKFCRNGLTGTNFQYHLLGDLMMMIDDWTETGESRRDIRPSGTLSCFREHM